MNPDGSNPKDDPFREFFCRISRRGFIRVSTERIAGGLMGGYVLSRFGKNGITGTSTWSPKRARLREIGIEIERYSVGTYNAITDVQGVRVDHRTKIEGSGELKVGVGPVRTGVTAISYEQI